MSTDVTPGMSSDQVMAAEALKSLRAAARGKAKPYRASSLMEAEADMARLHVGDVTPAAVIRAEGLTGKYKAIAMPRRTP